jgi:hypothetical protein
MRSPSSPAQTGRVLQQTFSGRERRSDPAGINLSNPALLPAVLVSQEADASLTDLQATDWQKIEEDFVEEIGGTDQNPNDPDYRVLWQIAQEKSDAMFRQKFGTVAFLKYNAEAGRHRSTP